MVQKDIAWKKSEAFRYVAFLDGPLLAWEYLRRNVAYRAAWLKYRLGTPAPPPSTWGCAFAIDPDLDARRARPVWHPDPPSTIRLVRAVSAQEGVTLRTLGMIERSADCVRDSGGVYVTAGSGTRPWCVHIADGVGQDDPVALSVSCDHYLDRRLAMASSFVASVGHSASPVPMESSRPTRAGRTHQLALQAFDGKSAGASQREIACALYGEAMTAERWTPDGELRARVRYFLRRSNDLVGGGYRRLPYL